MQHIIRKDLYIIFSKGLTKKEKINERQEHMSNIFKADRD